MHIYLWQIDPPQLLQLSIYIWKTITPNKFHLYIAQCTYTHGRLTPQPSQLSIDALNTATPNLADLPPINQA